MEDETPADKVPDTPHTPPEHPVEHPTPPAHDDSLRETVAKLQQAVDGLTERVEALTPVPGDDTPTSRPWTHRRFG